MSSRVTNHHPGALQSSLHAKSMIIGASNGMVSKPAMGRKVPYHSGVTSATPAAPRMRSHARLVQHFSHAALKAIRSGRVWHQAFLYWAGGPSCVCIPLVSSDAFIQGDGWRPHTERSERSCDGRSARPIAFRYAIPEMDLCPAWKAAREVSAAMHEFERGHPQQMLPETVT